MLSLAVCGGPAQVLVQKCESAVAVDAMGYLTRQTGVTWTSAGRADIRLDLIPDRAPFALTYFRQFVRNGFEKPDALEPIRHWTRTENFYVNTHNPRSGRPLAPSGSR